MKYATLLLAAATLALATPARAQGDAAPAAPADSVAILQQRIGQLQQQAMQDAAVQAASRSFEEFLMGAMARIDATAAEKKARADALMTEVAAARAAGDNAKLNALATEAQTLQAFFHALRPRAMEQADVQEKRREFLGALFAKMGEIDPQAQALVDRLQQLRAARAATPQQR